MSEQGDGGDLREVRLPGAGELGVGALIEEGVGFAVEDTVAMLDHGEADRLGEVALPRARRAEEQPVLVLGDEAAGGEFEDQAAVHLLVEVEIEGVQGLALVAEAGLLDAAGEQPVLAAEEFVADEGGEEVDGRQPGGLGLEQAGLEAGGHAGAAELAHAPPERAERVVRRRPDEGERRRGPRSHDLAAGPILTSPRQAAFSSPPASGGLHSLPGPE